MRRGDARTGPALAWLRPRRRDQLERQAIRIGQPQHPFAETDGRILDWHSEPAQPIRPVREGRLRHRERGGGDLTVADRAAIRAGKREERENGPGRTGRVAEVEVIRARVVEVDGP